MGTPFMGLRFNSRVNWGTPMFRARLAKGMTDRSCAHGVRLTQS